MVLFGTVVEYLEVQPHQEKQAGRLSALWFIARPASWQDSASRSTEEAISRLKLLLPWPAAVLTLPSLLRWTGSPQTVSQNRFLFWKWFLVGRLVITSRKVTNMSQFIDKGKLPTLRMKKSWDSWVSKHWVSNKNVYVSTWWTHSPMDLLCLRLPRPYHRLHITQLLPLAKIQLTRACSLLMWIPLLILRLYTCQNIKLLITLHLAYITGGSLGGRSSLHSYRQFIDMAISHTGANKS